MAANLKITPHGEIAWQVHDLNKGRLYLPSDHDESFNPMNIVDKVDDDRNRHKILGLGVEGVVYDIAGYAVKAFIGRGDWTRINTLRVNVALTEGLKRIAQPQNSAFMIRGAEIHAAYIPHDEFTEELGYRAVWLMEKINPVIRPSEYMRKREHLVGRRLHKKHPFPHFGQRRETYKAALNKYGLEVTDISQDEAAKQNINLMIESLPSDRTRGSVVKIDERPTSGKSSFDSY